MMRDVTRIAAQLSTTRDHCRTPSEFAASMAKVRAAGYTAVQVSGVGPMDLGEMSRILSGEGLACAATHEPAERILAEPGAVADKLNALGCDQTAYPYPAGRDFGSLESVLGFCRELNAAGKVLFERGITLSYHNHAFEFQRAGGKLVLEIIMAETDPRWLAMEIDTYWVQAGGGDPVDWCRRSRGRMPCLHLKDYGINAQGKPVFEEIGDGNLDWKAILAAADEVGVLWYIVEQDSDWEQGDPFLSLARSYRFLAGQA
jgi:sugar phosphate isomerase/epimerase